MDDNHISRKRRSHQDRDIDSEVYAASPALVFRKISSALVNSLKFLLKGFCVFITKRFLCVVLCVCVHGCVRACVRACSYVCAHVCMSVCGSVFTCACVHVFPLTLQVTYILLLTLILHKWEVIHSLILGIVSASHNPLLNSLNFLTLIAISLLFNGFLVTQVCISKAKVYLIIDSLSLCMISDQVYI